MSTSSITAKKTRCRNPNAVFSLHERKTQKGYKVWYCQFRLPSGKWGKARSTGVKSNGHVSEKRAEAWAMTEISKGHPYVNKSITLVKFAGVDFFKYAGEWELNKRIAGKKPPSLRWCLERTDYLKNHIIPRLGEYKLILIDEEVIIKFRNDLFTGAYGREYSGATINKILTTLREILKGAYRKKIISKIPLIELAGVNEKTRGRLTRDETARIFSIPWSDQRPYIASLIAASTGARLSEIRALKINDIQADGKIVIAKSYDRRTGILKNTTKNGKVRTVILPASHLACIMEYIQSHPYRERNGFLIYSKKESVPASETLIAHVYHEALARIGIDEAERLRRGICFHSWRYYANSIMIESGIPLAEVKERIGHCQNDDRITQRYFIASDNSQVPIVMGEAIPLHQERESPETIQ